MDRKYKREVKRERGENKVSNIQITLVPERKNGGKANFEEKSQGFSKSNERLGYKTESTLHITKQESKFKK